MALRHQVPQVGIFNLKENFNRGPVLFWFFLLMILFIITGAIFSFLRILLYIGLFVVGAFILYFIAWIGFNSG